MPKAKVTTSHTPTPATAQRTPVKIRSAGTPLWYKILMFGTILVGLIWLVVFYLAAPHIPLMVSLGVWNYLIGFTFIIVGLLMTMGWR